MQSKTSARAVFRYCLALTLVSPTLSALSQNTPPAGALSVEKIMRDPQWIGTSPSNAYWSWDGQYLFFNWNPDKAPADSSYYITRSDLTPHKASYSLVQQKPAATAVVWNTARTAVTFSREGDVYWVDAKTGKEKRITQTTDRESDPIFSFHDTRIVYARSGNLFSWEISTGETEQLTSFQHSPPPPREDKKATQNQQDKWLQEDQLRLFDVLRTRKNKRDQGDAINKSHDPKPLKDIYIDDRQLNDLDISPDGRFISYRLVKRAEGHSTVVPSYVTETGFTRDIPGRTKVGGPQGSYASYIFDREKDTVISIATDKLPGITDQPDYVKDYPARSQNAQEGKGTSDKSVPASQIRPVIVNGPYWSQLGTHAIVDIRSQDNKDRWLMSLDPATGQLSLVDRQRDEAWISGPGIGYSFGGGGHGWLNENTCWFQSEATGYSHLYTFDIATGKRTAMTSGNFEVQRTVLSRDKKVFYLVTNEVHPGEQQFYQLPVTGGKPVRVTTQTGANQVAISPDDKQLAILYSYSNQPWELYLQPNTTGSKASQITHLAMSEEFKAYPWRDPIVTSFTARDGAKVYARLYRPSGAITGKHPAVVFVHGAGYLQNAHKWWSSYFREFMFNNLLADNGYTVLDIDYRGSAGYGRDWRTGIYRHMGGKDLDDQVDGVKWLVEHEDVDPTRVGLYGGSYGGFITLMAMFTQPDVFAAGAGLRSVTDWAHYNHGYTSDILNEPYNDSLAYRRSSPIYFAEGLKGHLLMCHGMVDENVHFQDIVRLSQRLIELGKNNWELAVYPMEDHGFVEPSSWTDEYKRIFKLFENWLKNPR